MKTTPCPWYLSSTQCVKLPFTTYIILPASGNTNLLSTTEILVHAFVSSKLNHSNSLLFGVPKLHYIPNAAARLIADSRRYDHVTPIVIELHLLSFAKRIKFKLLLLTFKALHGHSPTWIKDLVSRHIPTRTLPSSSGQILNSVKVVPYSFMTERALMSRAVVICVRSCEIVSFSWYFMTSA